MIFTIGYLAKSVGPEAFGIWSLILVVQTLLMSAGGAGLASALIRYGPNADKDIAYQYIILSIKIINYNSVKLGTGDVDFNSVFNILKKNKFNGSYILQMARDEDSIGIAKYSIEFVNQFIF